MPFLKGILNIKSKWDVGCGKLDNEVGSWNNLTSHLANLASHFKLLTSKRGFTLIELLVVMTIIGVLSGLGYVNFDNAQDKARDARRKEDLKAIKTALVSYYQDHDAYPPLCD